MISRSVCCYSRRLVWVGGKGGWHTMKTGFIGWGGPISLSHSVVVVSLRGTLYTEVSSGALACPRLLFTNVTYEGGKTLGR